MRIAPLYAREAESSHLSQSPTSSRLLVERLTTWYLGFKMVKTAGMSNGVIKVLARTPKAGVNTVCIRTIWVPFGFRAYLSRDKKRHKVNIRNQRSTTIRPALSTLIASTSRGNEAAHQSPLPELDSSDTTSGTPGSSAATDNKSASSKEIVDMLHQPVIYGRNAVCRVPLSDSIAVFLRLATRSWYTSRVKDGNETIASSTRRTLYRTYGLATVTEVTTQFGNAQCRRACRYDKVASKGQEGRRPYYLEKPAHKKVCRSDDGMMSSRAGG
ncbi:hypothetical protein EDD85DRAFT_942791 [Armillaria nabsnona]|nr:hypothetical protein EDD85DRAFT_942791 [Armillaria nabsnona]